VHLIQEGKWHQVLIFTRTKHGANRLTQQLEGAGIKAAAIHGNKSQAARVKALDMFKRGQITALVATEVAARGLDIKELPQVVNYELPNVPEDYVHRIGRTGRAGAAGEAISLVSSDESGLLRDIERVLRAAFRCCRRRSSRSWNRRRSRLPRPAAARRPPPQRSGATAGGRAHGRRQFTHGIGVGARFAPRGGRRRSGGTRSFGQQQRGRFR
jgi:ATP-dependent RNA helicase RhlE